MVKSTSAVALMKRTSYVTTICCCICSAGVRCGCFLGAPVPASWESCSVDWTLCRV